MRIFRWTLASLLLAFGIFTLNFESPIWIAAGLAIYSVPFLGQLLPSVKLRVWLLWFGIFVALQTFVSPLALDLDYLTLQPNLNVVVDVKAGLPGIAGEQHITTDSQGYRVTRDIDYQADDPYRVFAVGGSTTEQIYLDDRKTWTHLLQEGLVSQGNPGVEVINTGVSGLRSPNHLSTLKHVLSFEPDMVLFMMGINDWNYQITQEFAGPGPIRAPRGLLLGNSMLAQLARGLRNTLSVEQPGEAVVRREDHGEYYTERRGSLERQTKREFLPEDVDPSYAIALQSISEICHEFSVTGVFLSQPSGYTRAAEPGFQAGFWMTPPNQDYTLPFESMVHIAAVYNDYLLRFAADNGHASCDLAKDVEPTYEFFYDDCHFNENGARHVAELLTNCISPLII